MATQALRVQRLYRLSLQAATKFKTYNFRVYFQAHVKAKFQQLKRETDAAKREALLATFEVDLAVLRRQATINQLFATGDSIMNGIGVAPAVKTVL